MYLVLKKSKLYSIYIEKLYMLNESLRDSSRCLSSYRQLGYRGCNINSWHSSSDDLSYEMCTNDLDDAITPGFTNVPSESVVNQPLQRAFAFNIKHFE